VQATLYAYNRTSVLLQNWIVVVEPTDREILALLSLKVRESYWFASRSDRMPNFNRFWNECWATPLFVYCSYVLIEGFIWNRLFVPIRWLYYSILWKHHIVAKARKGLRCWLVRSSNTQLQHLDILFTLFIFEVWNLFQALFLDFFRLLIGFVLSWLIVVLTKRTPWLICSKVFLLNVAGSSKLILNSSSHFKAIVDWIWILTLIFQSNRLTGFNWEYIVRFLSVGHRGLTGLPHILNAFQILNDYDLLNYRSR